MLEPLTETLRNHGGASTGLERSDAWMKYFGASKHAIADAVLFVHPKRDATTWVPIDTSANAIGSALQPFGEIDCVPLAFLSKKLRRAKTRYSPLGRELLADCMPNRYVRARWSPLKTRAAEGGEFYAMTHHKPLKYVVVATTIAT